MPISNVLMIFVSNADEEKSKLLNWKQRLNIIVGTAEGLAHLHGAFEALQFVFPYPKPNFKI